ncbi:hypothetical protein CLAFUW4_14075 [Fulvia fulva]|uniref:Uncharacterized protein n=1 Tax=Passalora fulva TaxID=5499 RepID=A0A9Q8UVW0_PASFU|nr:uncharacterized protein CLAFUR5_13913 [Fulvia fulva]KAK4610328.1 hypothetical protein CLAFUR4_14078 [Fulvia fulva]KAK4611227.1 hypothetical protein CLAFUR0_14082 [Fulvia fulva]UJO24383.1 hypothetical protein CLAFUR5_13913 [Fulvia fulva]WPV21824.1 hypothetical protein CLAFUW4_14075 [Fulvia fulva]WPV36836.1 hypothetical protein CLAFUW7_14086 [Fulvia fulva]
MDLNRVRTSSASTGDGRERAMSVFSEGYQTATTAPTSPATSLPSAYKSGEDDDDEILEIDKETFERNIEHTRKDSCQFEQPIAINDSGIKIINGSTFGGTDPLHSHIRLHNMEPRWWIEERQRSSQIDRYNSRPPTTKRKRSAEGAGLNKAVTSAYLDPTWYDTLSYSRQDAFTSGLDMDSEPEETSEEFWEKVTGAWRLSMRYESVEERREAFEVEFDGYGDLGEGETTEMLVGGKEERGEFRQEWFRDELEVGVGEVGESW